MWYVQGGVKIILRLTWVTFAVGTRWSALGVGCRARRREEKAEVSRRRRGEEAGDETGTERNSTSDGGAIPFPNYVHGYVLYTMGLEAPMWYVQGRTVAVHTVGLGVPLGSAEHGGRVARGLQGTLDVDPNPNGIVPLHRLARKLLQIKVQVSYLR